MKICCTCKEDLPETDFYWKNKSKDLLQPYCKQCKSEYNRRWYQTHSEDQKKRARINQAKLVEIHNKEKLVPCADCGIQYDICVMDFDHIGGDKIKNVSALARAGNLKKLLAEIAKCEVVCANCHRMRTSSRRSQADKATFS